MPHGDWGIQTRKIPSVIPAHICNSPGAQIVHFEMWGIIIGLKLWGHTLKGLKFKILCNNEAVVTVLQTGRARDLGLQTLLREAVFLQAKYNFEMSSEHIQGVHNRTCDVLSRIHVGKKYLEQFQKMKQKDWVEDTVKAEMFHIINSLFQISTRVKLCIGCRYLMNSVMKDSGLPIDQGPSKTLKVKCTYTSTSVRHQLQPFPADEWQLIRFSRYVGNTVSQSRTIMVG